MQPVISPAGGISEIFRYELRGPPGMDVMQLKTLQDWVVERKLRIVPGVADVNVLGGKTKEFQVEIDLNRMMAYGMTLPQIIAAISASNSNVGGRTIAMGEQSVNVRGLGVVSSLEDIGNIVLTQQGGVPVLLSDVAKVQIGFTPRLGIAGRDDKTDVVTGIVLMQKLERTMDVVPRVRAAVEKINTDGSLPPGVKIEPFYDRGDLVAITVNTVLHNMMFGIALIFLIQWVFLGNLRCALIVSATIPVALFLAVIITVLRGESANLLSVGAIDLGIIVDATVIMMENIYRHLSRPRAADGGTAGRARGRSHRQAASHPDRRHRGRQADLLLGDHHHRRVPAAVHHAGRGGPDLRPDGAHLCLRAARRRHRHLHGHAGDVLDPAAGARQRGRDVPGALHPPRLSVGAAAGRAPPLRVGGDRPRLSRRVRPPGAAARHRVPAQARGRQPVDPRPAAAHHHARGRDGQRGAHAQHHQELRAGARRCSPSRAAARTAPIPTAPSSPSSSCR